MISSKLLNGMPLDLRLSRNSQPNKEIEKDKIREGIKEMETKKTQRINETKSVL